MGKARGGGKRPKTSSFEIESRPTYSGAPAHVTRQQYETTIHLDWEKLPRAHYRFAVNCGRAFIRDGYPELQLGQLHPLSTNRLAKLLVIRYEPQRFVDRARDNAKFARDLQSSLETREERGLVGHYSSLIEEADGEDCDAAILDAEVEWFFRLGHYAYGVFVSSYSRDVFRVTVGQSDTLPMQPIVEVSMPLRVLADLMASWQAAAEQIGAHA